MMRALLQKLIKVEAKPQEVAERLVRQLSVSAHKVFWEKKFRRLLSWEILSITEQDRIFNELQLSALLYTQGAIEQWAKRYTGEKRVYWEQVGTKIMPTFLDFLEQIGVKAADMNMWRKLFDMRLKEYAEHYEIAREEWKDEFTDDEVEMGKVTSWIITVAIDSATHITRGGELAEHDPVRRWLAAWLISLNRLLVKARRRVREDVF